MHARAGRPRYSRRGRRRYEFANRMRSTGILGLPNYSPLIVEIKTEIHSLGGLAMANHNLQGKKVAILCDRRF